MNKPKILVLSSSYPVSGGDSSGLFVKELSARLIKSFNVFVLAPFSGGSNLSETQNGLQIRRYKYWPGKKLLGDGEIMANLRKSWVYYLQVIPFMFFQLLAVRQIIKKEQIKVLHAHWLIPQALIAIIYKTLFGRRIKVVATVHGGDINNFQTGLYRPLVKFILRNLDEVTVVSNAIKEIILGLGYKKEIHVYPMGVDTATFSPLKQDNTIRELHRINGYFLLFVGGLIHRKGIPELIDAMPIILKEHPDAKLVVVGSGNLDQEMKNRCKTLGIEENIVFTGPLSHEELPKYFATADLFILPSFSEGFGLVVAEALSAGTLAVTSNLKPINDIIIDNQTGFYVENVDKTAIAEKVNEILSDNHNFDSVKARGRKHVVDNFDWKQVSDNYCNLLENTINADNV